MANRDQQLSHTGAPAAFDLIAVKSVTSGRGGDRHDEARRVDPWATAVPPT